MAIIVALSIAIVAIIGVVLGIALNDRKEVTVAGVCWSEASVIRYEWDGPQECSPIEWNRDSFPLLVHAEAAYPDSPDPNKAVLHAIGFINQRLGFRAFNGSENKRPDVYVKIGVSQDDTWDEAGGRAYHKRDANGRMIGYVETCNVGEISMLNLVLIHELLHILGLGHDDWEGSIMYSVQQTTTEEVVNLGRLWISDADTLYLQRYAPR